MIPVQLRLKLKQIRKSRMMSQAKLAQITSISRSYLCEMEKGRYDPTISKLCRIARALACTLDELVDCLGEEECDAGDDSES